MNLKINSTEVAITLYNIQIPLLKDLMLQSHKYLPYTFFSKSCFKKHEVQKDSSIMYRPPKVRP